MLHMIFLAGLVTAFATQAPASGPTVAEPLSVFTGDWHVVDTVTGKILMDCTKAQSFAVTPDRKTIVLTEKSANNWTAKYMVLHQEEDRVLTFIENEERTTDAGDPVLWWAYFNGPDKFRWRRYDWRRCPAAR